MGENSAIEWTTHTFNPCQSLARGKKIQSKFVEQPVARLAQGDAVGGVRPSFWMLCEGQNVVDMQVATSIIPAVPTHETIARHAVIAPSLVGFRKALTPSFDALAVYVSGRVLTASSALAHLCADHRAGFVRVLFANAVTWPRLCSRTHFFAAFIGHLFPLHRGDKGAPALFPRLSYNFASGEFFHG